jgi:phosphatidylserine decarboxylase precursor-related protein
MNNYIHRAPEAIAVPLILMVTGILVRMWNITVIGAVSIMCMLFFYRGAPSLKNRTNIKTIGFGLDTRYPVTCPCDGKVLHIERVRGSLHIAMFLNVHNVHVQYAPFDGVIVSMEHKPGTFAPAYLFEKSQYNERLVTTFETAVGPMTVAQIAGQVARRIVPFHRPGARVHQGEPFGLIKLGSRVDVWIPDHRVTELLVKVGDRVRIGDGLCMVR